MIQGFTRETHELSAEELVWAEKISRKIKLNIGHHRAVTNSQIAQYFLKSFGVKIGSYSIGIDSTCEYVVFIGFICEETITNVGSLD